MNSSSDGVAYGHCDRSRPRVRGLVRGAFPRRGVLHRRAQPESREDGFRPGTAPGHRDDPGRCDRRVAERCGEGTLRLSAGPGHHAGRSLFQVAVGERARRLGRDRDGQHGLGSGVARGEPGWHRARSGDQGPVGHGLDGPDPLSGLGTEPLCLHLRRQSSHRPRDGVLRVRAPRTDRHLRGTAERHDRSSPRRWSRSKASRSTTSAKTCAT